MANDILNTSNGATGNQNLGKITVKQEGRGTNSTKQYNAALHTIDISTIAAKYDARFDDPRYYQGDADT
jgi:hypothetical protein